MAKPLTAKQRAALLLKATARPSPNEPPPWAFRDDWRRRVWGRSGDHRWKPKNRRNGQ